MKLREIENYDLKILNEKSKDGSMIVYAKFSEAEKRNQNSRIYPLEILSREVNRVQSKIASGQFLGQADHGDSPATFLKNVSHIVTGLEMKGNNGYATIKILNTDVGKNCQEIIRGKGRIGISTRSTGTVDPKTGRIQSDLKLLALDLVANPSVKDATIGKENILEGLEFEQENIDDESIEDKEQAMYEMLETSYSRGLEQGFEGTFDDYCDQHESAMRKIMLLPEKDGKKFSIKKLTEEQKVGRIQTYFFEAISAGYHGSLDEWKKEFPQLVAKAKGEDVPMDVIKESANEDYNKLITAYQEAVQAGFSGNFDEWKDKYPEIIESVLEPKTEKKDPLEIEAKRIFTELKKQNPNSSLQLESVRNMLLKEEEPFRAKKLRELAIHSVNKSLAGCGDAPSQELLEKMIADEEKAIKEERAEKKRKNWEAYRRLLD